MRSKRSSAPLATAYASAITSTIKSGCLTKAMLRAMQTLYSFRGHAATAGQVAKKMGYRAHGGACLRIGSAGRVLANTLRIGPLWGDDPEANWWSVIANEGAPGKYFIWKMRDEVAEALESLDLVDRKRRSCT